MFCPICGRDNSQERKFCVSCGTNLEAVSQALSGSQDDFFTKIDTALDHFIGRYAEHVFKNSPAHASERKVGKSWLVLGQGALTSLVDLLLFSLMWNLLPLRFFMLLISTPIRLLAERGGRQKEKATLQGQPPLELTEPAPGGWLPGSALSAGEPTTEKLREYQPPKQ